MTYTRWIRLALGYLGFFSAQIGFWALLAPRSFYDSFPGMGRSWISIDGPYNEHLIRDVGALNLAMLALMVGAAVTLSRPLVITAAVAALVWGVPHALYHLFNTGGLGGVDLAMSLGGLLMFAGLPLAVIALANKHLGDGGNGSGSGNDLSVVSNPRRVKETS